MVSIRNIRSSPDLRGSPALPAELFAVAELLLESGAGDFFLGGKKTV
jgi:hypothetical protein